MCRVLEVSESGYYKYLRNLGKPDKDAVLSAAIQKILDESEFNDNYGVPRMQMALALNGHKVGTRRLKRIMLKMGLIHERKRRPKVGHIRNFLQIYLRSSVLTASCTSRRSSTASTERSCLSS